MNNEHKWIVTYPRSGSTYLCELLNNNFGFDFKENIRNAMKNCKKISIEDLKEEKVHASDFNLTLRRDLPKDTKYILLKRNIIDSVASFYIAKNTGLWNEKVQLDAYEIDMEVLSRYLKYYLDYRDFWEKKLQGHEFILVNYEDLVLDPVCQIDRIADFLLLERKEYKLHTDLQKNEINYNPLKEVLRSLVSQQG